MTSTNPNITLPTHRNKTSFYGTAQFNNGAPIYAPKSFGDPEGKVTVKGDGHVDDGFFASVPDDKIGDTLDGLEDAKLKRFLSRLGPRTEDNMPSQETLEELAPKILGEEWSFGFFSTGTVSSGGKSWKAKDFLLRGPNQSLTVNFRTADVRLRTSGKIGDGFRFSHEIYGSYEPTDVSPWGGQERGKVWSLKSRHGEQPEAIIAS